MQENKEFEEVWEDRVKEAIKSYRNYSDPKNKNDYRYFYEAGQQSERDKHRWIPVTEKLPTEKDGDYDNEHNCVIVNVKFSDNSVSSASYDLSEKYFECLRKPVSWQPLPEA